MLHTATLTDLSKLNYTVTPTAQLIEFNIKSNINKKVSLAKGIKKQL